MDPKTLISCRRLSARIVENLRAERADFGNAGEVGQEPAAWLLDLPHADAVAVLGGFSVDDLQDLSWSANQGGTNADERGDTDRLEDWQEIERWIDALVEAA